MSDIEPLPHPLAPEAVPEVAGVRTLLRDRAFMASMVVAVVVALGFGLVVPVLPEFARSFGVSRLAVGALISVFALVRLVSNLFTGALADRIGARRAVGYGAIIVAVSSVLSAAAPNYPALVILRGAGGLGSALFFNALLTLVITATPASMRGRAVGTLQGAFLLGIALGPSVGGLLAEPLGLRWPLAIYGVFCGLAGVIALWLLPKVKAASMRRPNPWGTLRRFLRTPEFVAALLMVAGERWAQAGVRFSLVPIFGTEVLGLDTAAVGLGLTLAALVHLALTWPAGRLVDLAGRRTLSWTSHAAFAAVCLGLAYVTGLATFLLVLALFGAATAFSSVPPPAIVGDVVGEENTGLAVGALNTAGDLGSVLGPVMCGWLADTAGYPAAFGSAAVLLLAGAVAAFRMRETLPARAAAPAYDR